MHTDGAAHLSESWKRLEPHQVEQDFIIGHQAPLLLLQLLGKPGVIHRNRYPYVRMCIMH